MVHQKRTERFEGCITKASPTCSHLDLVSHVPTHSQHSSCTLRNVFIAAHVHDLAMVRSSSQLNEVVSEMKQCFTMKVTLPLSASDAQTYVGARYWRRNGAVLEFPITLGGEEYGMKSANPKVSPALTSNDDDEDEDEATTKERRMWRPVVGVKLQIHNKARMTLTVFTDNEWASDRPTRKSVSSLVILLAQSSREAEYIHERSKVHPCSVRSLRSGSAHASPCRQHWCH